MDDNIKNENVRCVSHKNEKYFICFKYFMEKKVNKNHV